MRALLLVAVMLLCACPPGDGGPAKTCVKAGSTCVFEPGKLGVCVAREGCQGDGCLACQSQH